jgi:hypothetical protein
MRRARPLCVEPRIEFAIGGVDPTTPIFHANADLSMRLSGGRGCW